MNIHTVASHEYSSRPKDERFPSLEAMVENAEMDKGLSVERGYNLKDLRAIEQDGKLLIASPKGPATFNHWSFGQFARMIEAPAGYLRRLPPMLAADNINHGIQNSEVGSKVSLLVRQYPSDSQGRPNPEALPLVRGVTTESYGRVWDADLYRGISRTVQGDNWSTPPTWSGEPAGAYRGTNDSFLIYTNGGSIVTDPTLTTTGQGQMYRGILVRNSEVGAAAVTIEAILYRYVCGNHMLWGAIVDKSFRRRHVGQHAFRDTIREIGTLAHRWVNRSASMDETLIKLLVSHELASTKEGIVDELMKMGSSKENALAAFASVEANEIASPRSFWGISQGITRVSQESGYQDDRLELDKLALLVLKRGKELVAA